MTKVITLNSFDKICKEIATSGQKVNQLSHDAGVFALNHAKESGDIRQVDSVYRAMQTGHLRAEGFRVWVEMFSPIRWNGDGIIGLLKPNNKMFTPFDVDTAKARPFWTLAEAKEQVQAKEISIATLIAALNKRLKEAEDAHDDGFIYNKDGIAKYEVKGNVVAFRAAASRARIKLQEIEASSGADTVAASAAEKISAAA